MTDKTYTEEEVQALISEKLTSETEGLKKKVEELLSEKKAASIKAAEAEEAKKQAEDEKLKSSQEFKTLYEREQAEKKSLAEQLHEYRASVQKRDLDSAALQLANSMTRDSKRGELLKEQILKHAKYEDGNVSFELAGMAVDQAKLKDHLTENWGFLVDGSGNTGGGAAGANEGGGAATKAFNEYTPAELSAIRAEDPEKYNRIRATAPHLN